MKSYSDSYKAAGVDVTAGYESVELMKEHVKRTVIPGVVSGIGGFGGLFAPDLAGMEEPVLVSGTDGVGTKLKIAMLLDKHDTIGIDCRGHVRQRRGVLRRPAPVLPGLHRLRQERSPRRLPTSWPAWPRAASSPAAPSSAARRPSIPA